VTHDDSTLKWGIWATKPPRSIRVVAEVGYCIGDPRPSRRPHIQYIDDNVYIRLKVHVPRKKSFRCAGVGLFIKRWIMLRRNLDEVKIYDSGYNPPQLVWPED